MPHGLIRPKSEFLSSMSHELRTPLNAVLGFAQTLQSNLKEPLTDRQKKSVDLIMSSGQLLLALINQILELSRIETGKLDLIIETVEPGSVIKDCLTITQTMAEPRSITVMNNAADNDLPSVQTDLTRLKQVLLNLLSNAVKYNRDGGSVIIDAEETAERMLRVSVSDTGSGLPKKDHNRVFDPFDRLGMETTKIQGTGIGLAISKRLMDALGGCIGFDSETERGSTFWIELPLSEKAEHQELALDLSENQLTPEQPLGEGSQHHRMLYIEDNPMNVYLMQTIFEGISNAELLAAADAEEGVELATSEQPDLILMDIGLPGMDGIEAAGVLKNTKKTKHIPIIAISAAAMKDDIERAKDAGFFAYLTKPINVTEFLKVLRRILDDEPAPW